MQENSELVIIAVSVTVLMLMLCSFIVFFVVRYRKRQEEHETEKKRLKLEYELEGDKALLELTEQNMKSISQEIHDNVGQSLSLAKLYLNTMNEMNFNDYRVVTIELVTRAIQDLRDISRLLSGHFVLENGLEKSILRELNLIETTGQIQCDFKADVNGYFFNEEHEVILFRCAQETLNNILKYASATKIEVLLLAKNDRLILQISDNGIGFDVQKYIKGLGIRNIQNRAKVLRGTCKIDSTIGSGTTVIFDLPLHYSILATTQNSDS